MWFKRRTPSPEIEMAERAVVQSRRRALRDLEVATANLAESNRVCQLIRAHNEANHYDSWLEEVVRDFRR